MEYRGHFVRELESGLYSTVWARGNEEALASQCQRSGKHSVLCYIHALIEIGHKGLWGPRGPHTRRQVFKENIINATAEPLPTEIDFGISLRIRLHG